MKNKIVYLFTILVFISGCMPPMRQFHGLEPISPPVSMFLLKFKVDSLQPEFRWKASPIEGSTYDFAIWEIGRKKYYQTGQVSWGTQVYYIENLKENYHKVEKPLNPDTFYNWSVRLRRGNIVGDWSSYDETIVDFSGTYNKSNSLFLFKTPDK